MPKNTNSNNLIVFEKVNKTYPGNSIALQDVSVAIGSGEFVCIVGPSGCGKSTILKLIAGLETPVSGTVHRPSNVAMVFQNSALLPWLSAAANVEIAVSARGTAKAAAKKTAAEFTRLLGLSEFANKYPHELSGGQRQRVGIARAFAVRPEVLLLDEPFSALDVVTTEQIHQDLLRLWRQTQTTIVMISHSVEEAVALAERVIVIGDHTVQKIFSVSLPRPRREQEKDFMHEVQTIRKELFK